MKIINSFRGEYFFLSNMSEYGFYDIDSLWYPTSEHYYQLHKVEDYKQYYESIVSVDAFNSKKMGKKLPVRDNWDQIKIIVMNYALRLKFDQNENIRKKLIQLEGYYIVEENNWGDTEWGTCNKKGKNLLGICLMCLRNQYIINERKKINVK